MEKCDVEELCAYQIKHTSELFQEEAFLTAKRTPFNTIGLPNIHTEDNRDFLLSEIIE